MTIRDELLSLKNDDDLIVPEAVISWAKENPTSALHSSLEWDNKKAAHEFRLWQVRKLIAIHVVSEEGTRQVISLSIDRQREGGGYRALEDVLPRPDLREVLLNDALRDLERVQGKYEHVTELARVWDEVKKVRRRRIPQKEAPQIAAG